MRLDPQCESASRYDLDSRPWWRQILASITDPEIRSVTVMASTQVGKTLTLQAAILYVAEHDPAPAMVVLPDEKSAIEFRDRLYLNAMASIKKGGLKRVRVPKPRLWNSRRIDLGTMQVYLAWSGARQGLRGRPCRRVFLSEVDVYEGDKKAGDPVAQSHQRTKAFWRFLHYHESSPGEHPSPIAELEQAADVRYRWHCRCPRCDHEQELRFFPNAAGPHAGRGGVVGVKDASGGVVSADVARRQAAYECEACRCRIDDAGKQAFVGGGRWVPVSTSSETSRRSVGYHLWTAHSETQSWGDLAASYCEAVEKGKLREWWGNWLGLPYRRQGRVPQWVEVGERLACSHQRGTVPRDAWFLTSGLDVQGDGNGCRYVIRAWGPQRMNWLVDWGWIERGEATAGAEIVRADIAEAGRLILQRSFPTVGGANPLGLDKLDVRLLNADSGHAPKKVHDWLRSLPADWVIGDGTERVRAVKGSGQLDGVRYQRSVVEKNVRTGEAYDGGMVVWRLSVAEMYPDLLDSLFAHPGTPGALHFFADAVATSKAYLQQVCNLEKRVKVDDRTGRLKVEWGRRSSQIPIDFADAEIYAAFAAEMVVGVLGWSADAWRQAWKPASQQQRQDQTQGEQRQGEQGQRQASEREQGGSRRRITFRR